MLKVSLAIMFSYMLFTSTSEVIHMPAAFSNPWFLSIYGWVLYNVAMVWFDRKKYDLDNDGLGLSEVGMFLKHEWIGMLLSLMLVPFITPYAPNIWGWFMDVWGKDWEFVNMAYGGVGVIMMLLQYAISWLKSKIESNNKQA